jgi:hypothetical protein
MDEYFDILDTILQTCFDFKVSIIYDGNEQAQNLVG